MRFTFFKYKNTLKFFFGYVRWCYDFCFFSGSEGTTVVVRGDGLSADDGDEDVMMLRFQRHIGVAGYIFVYYFYF